MFVWLNSSMYMYVCVFEEIHVCAHVCVFEVVRFQHIFAAPSSVTVFVALCDAWCVFFSRSLTPDRFQGTTMSVVIIVGPASVLGAHNSYLLVL